MVVKLFFLRLLVSSSHERRPVSEFESDTSHRLDCDSWVSGFPKTSCLL